VSKLELIPTRTKALPRMWAETGLNPDGTFMVVTHDEPGFKGAHRDRAAKALGAHKLTRVSETHYTNNRGAPVALTTWGRG